MAAWGLVGAIHLYRWVARHLRWSRRCLFAVSCSRHAEQVARAEGAGVAVRAIRARFAACRPGYSFEFGGAGWQVRCVDGSVIADADASTAIHAEAAACLRALPAL
jgi:putative component of membrane protein insertase Oxa1/YidC/SpoIIIJ protein YidD